MTETSGGSGIRRAVLIALAIVGVTVLHYTTPTSRPVYHEVYNRLYYLPIILGAFFFGLRGGLTVSILVSLIFVPHILVDWGGFRASNVNMVAEVVLYNVVGAVTGLLVSTERKYRRRLEETGSRLRESLRELEEKTNMLVQRDEELRQSERLSLLGEMSAMMAHEIRNPLGSIQGAAEILSDSFREGDEGYRYAAILLKEVDRLSDVIDNFIRVGSGRKERHESVDINQLLEELRFFFERIAAQRKIAVESHLDPYLPGLTADPNQLRQAFMNLILNAVHAMVDGGRLTISTETVEEGLEVTFTDNGPGIPPEGLSRLFEPFYTTRNSGTGLGLTITKRIVEAHGGKIEVESEIGKGTTVRIFLAGSRGAE
jgi:signal transduction histidine kinase